MEQQDVELLGKNNDKIHKEVVELPPHSYHVHVNWAFSLSPWPH